MHPLRARITQIDIEITVFRLPVRCHHPTFKSLIDHLGDLPAGQAQFAGARVIDFHPRLRRVQGPVLVGAAHAGHPLQDRQHFTAEAIQLRHICAADAHVDGGAGGGTGRTALFLCHRQGQARDGRRLGLNIAHHVPDGVAALRAWRQVDGDARLIDIQCTTVAEEVGTGLEAGLGAHRHHALVLQQGFLQPGDGIHGLHQRRARQGVEAQLEIARVEARQHLAADEYHGAHADQQQDNGRQQGLFRVVQGPMQEGEIALAEPLHEGGERHHQFFQTPGLRLVMRPQPQGGEQGNQRHRDDEGRGQGEAEGKGQGRKQLAHEAAQEHQRNQHRKRRHGTGQVGEKDLLRALDGRLGRRLARHLQVPVDILQHHDTVIHQQTDGENDGRHGDHVEVDARQPHEREGHQKRHRDGDGDDGRLAQIGQEQEHHADGQHDGQHNGGGHVADHQLGEDGIVVGDGELDLRKLPPQVVQRLAHVLRHIDGIGLLALEHLHGDGRRIVEVVGGARFLLALAHRRQIRQAHHPVTLAQDHQPRRGRCAVQG